MGLAVTARLKDRDSYKIRLREAGGLPMKQDSWRLGAAPWLLSILRMVAAFLFMEHGGQKLFHFPPSAHPMNHLPPLLLVAGVLESFGGLLVFAGVFTRPVAFLLSGEMAVAYFRQHLPNGFWPINNGGEQAAFYCFFFLYLSAAGGGPISLERLWRKGR
jgi:putative oxidoreductase